MTWSSLKECRRWHKETDTQLDIAPYKLNRPRSLLSENMLKESLTLGLIQPPPFILQVHRRRKLMQGGPELEAEEEEEEEYVAYRSSFIFQGILLSLLP